MERGTLVTRAFLIAYCLLGLVVGIGAGVGGTFIAMREPDGIAQALTAAEDGTSAPIVSPPIVAFIDGQGGLMYLLKKDGRWTPALYVLGDEQKQLTPGLTPFAKEIK